MNREALECRVVTREWVEPLADLFAALERAGDEATFHPHALDRAQAERIARREGADLYYVLTDGANVLAYGMLRGWDAGFDVPSLGIAVHPDHRGRGLGRMFMEFLHASARTRGAKRVRLKVHADNADARDLYAAMGYSFDDVEGDQLVGILEL